MHNPLFQCLKYFRILPLALCALLYAGHAYAFEDNAFDRSSAVIFAYQRVGEDLFPANNLGTDQFKEQLQEMIEGEYKITPLSDIITALQSGAPLPDKTVALTFNGAYQSALKNAIPLLLEQNIPFTVFFSPDQADGKNPEYMSWADLKRLRKYNQVALGLHPSSYKHLAHGPVAEIRRQVNNALTRYRQELKTDPAFFAYPFGEYTKEFRTIIRASGFKAAFGQQSGAAYNGSDMFALPRFSMTENYGDEERFRMAALALPLPVTDIAPDDPHITENNPPTIGFTIDESLATKIHQMSCFISEQGKPDIQVVGKNRVEIRVTQPFQGARIRLNCTMPGPTAKAGEDQRWRWFGLLMTLNQPDDMIDNFETDQQAGPYPN